MSDTNQLVQLQTMARSLKFRIQEEEELYYPCSENKGADQLCSYCEADLHLCFRISNNPVFSGCGSFPDVASTMCSRSLIAITKKAKLTWKRGGVVVESRTPN